MIGYLIQEDLFRYQCHLRLFFELIEKLEKQRKRGRSEARTKGRPCVCVCVIFIYLFTYDRYSPSVRAKIGKYACHHGVAAAARYFS